ncbi:MAG: hypothetical protein ACRDBO_03910 [Lachnospiraceae bacterium]
MKHQRVFLGTVKNWQWNRVMSMDYSSFLPDELALIYKACAVYIDVAPHYRPSETIVLYAIKEKIEHMIPEQEEVLQHSMMKENSNTEYREYNFVAKFGKDDYSVWNAMLPIADVERNNDMGILTGGSLQDVFEQLSDSSEKPESVLYWFDQNSDGFRVLKMEPDAAFIEDYSSEGSSVRGNTAQIMEELEEPFRWSDEWEAAKACSGEEQEP